MALTTEQLRARIGHLKERLRDMNQHKYPDDCPNATAYLESLKSERQQDIALLEELLANREAQPVFFIEIEGDDWINAGRIQGKDRPDLGLLPDGINYLYATPPAPAVPDGFKLVPTVPTPEMIAAAMDSDDVSFGSDESFCVNFGNIYAAMLKAAPGEPQKC